MDALRANKFVIWPFTSELSHQLSNRTTKLFEAANLSTPAVVSINKKDALLINYPEFTKTPDYTALKKHSLSGNRS